MNQAPENRAERKELYEKVLRTVDENTGGEVMLPGQSETRLGTILKSHASEDAAAVEKAVQAAVDNGDLIRYPGTVRDCQRLAVAEEEQLREVLAAMNERVERARQTMEIVAEALAEESDE